ncbi:MAG: hypothetical protein HYX90_09465, partial [Chloroflexi bacterium]|nr:hypothetical protein [Chloroflexota bacterium]
MKMRLWLLFVPICIIMAFPLACGSGATPRPTQAPTSRAATSPALSQSPSSPSKPVSPPVAAPVSFAGKTITLIVPSSAGGATDLAGRLYARYLPKYLPGNPVMVVRNLPAGEGTVAVNSFYVSAKPDGLAILIGVSKASLGQLMGSGEVKYDFMKMPVLIAVANGIGYYIKPGIIAKPEDLPKARGIIFGYSSGAGAWIYLTAKELLGIPTDKIILAYQGSADARRAFLAGEINSSCEATSGYQQNIAPSVEKGQIMPIFQSGILDETGNVVKDPP